MGFVVVIDEERGEVTVTMGDKIVSTFHPRGLKEGLKARQSGVVEITWSK